MDDKHQTGESNNFFTGTGWPMIDNLMNTGFSSTELIVFASARGVEKTRFLEQEMQNSSTQSDTQTPEKQS
jgi:hypothetical protein